MTSNEYSLLVFGTPSNSHGFECFNLSSPRSELHGSTVSYLDRVDLEDLKNGGVSIVRCMTLDNVACSLIADYRAINPSDSKYNRGAYIAVGLLVEGHINPINCFVEVLHLEKIHAFLQSIRDSRNAFLPDFKLEQLGSLSSEIAHVNFDFSNLEVKVDTMLQAMSQTGVFYASNTQLAEVTISNSHRESFDLQFFNDDFIVEISKLKSSVARYKQLFEEEQERCRRQQVVVSDLKRKLSEKEARHDTSEQLEKVHPGYGIRGKHQSYEKFTDVLDSGGSAEYASRRIITQNGPGNRIKRRNSVSNRVSPIVVSEIQRKISEDQASQDTRKQLEEINSEHEIKGKNLFFEQLADVLDLGGSSSTSKQITIPNRAESNIVRKSAAGKRISPKTTFWRKFIFSVGGGLVFISIIALSLSILFSFNSNAPKELSKDVTENTTQIPEKDRKQMSTTTNFVLRRSTQEDLESDEEHFQEAEKAKFHAFSIEALMGQEVDIKKINMVERAAAEATESRNSSVSEQEIFESSVKPESANAKPNSSRDINQIFFSD